MISVKWLIHYLHYLHYRWNRLIKLVVKAVGTLLWWSEAETKAEQAVEEAKEENVLDVPCSDQWGPTCSCDGYGTNQQ